MNKKLKEITIYIGIFIFVFIVPHLLFRHFEREDRELFYERVNQNQEICLQRAERDSVEKRWCDEIRKASVTNFQLTENYQNTRVLLLLFQPIFFVLLISLRNLRKEIEKLKEKLNV